MKKRIIILLMLALFANITLFAGTTGKIAGKVKDQNGDSVPFANVIIEGLQQGAQTKENGTYMIINVQPGTYNVVCSQVGYQAAKITGVNVNLDETSVVNIILNKTLIEVEGYVVTERKEELVSKTNTSSGKSISSDDIEDIAVSDIEGLVALQAGAVQTGGELHVRGGRGNEVVYSIDGMSVSDPVDGGQALSLDTDAIADMKVMTGGFTAEYGNAQSGIVNIVTKSGSANYSGKLEFKTDHPINYDNPDDAFFPIYNSNSDELKFAIGGPVLTPLVSSLRNKFTFYFNAAMLIHDSRYKDLYISNPVEELKYLTNDKFASSDPYEERDSVLGIDISERNYNMYNYNFKTKYLFSPRQNMTFAIRGDYSNYLPYSHAWKYALEHYMEGESQQKQYIMTYDHTFSPQANLKVKMSQYNKKTTSGPKGISRDMYFVKNAATFDSLAANEVGNNTGIEYHFTGGQDEAYLYELQYLADSVVKDVPGYVRPGRVFSFNSNDENTITTIKSDFEYQYNMIHGFKTGFEVIKHSIKKDQLSNPWKINPNRYDSYLKTCTAFDSVFNETDSIYVPLYDLDDLYDATIAASGTTDGYEANPWQFAYYLQDKMEFEGMNVNAGMRFDFWYLGEKYKMIKDGGQEVWAEFDKDERFQMMISPRLGISHPISEVSVLHFAYNYQNQLPQMQYVFTTAQSEDANLSSNVVVGTPDLEPQVTITY
ncbi:MAG: carboxypeptidase regulatory-like domain-containing protein, partial [Candidatus Cloacimonetes bacterium]|nr:carboxypeptidase regulatory-like domain-containing protein [Candidatus Cloacimonadota bacterium]